MLSNRVGIGGYSNTDSFQFGSAIAHCVGYKRLSSILHRFISVLRRTLMNVLVECQAFD